MGPSEVEAGLGRVCVAICCRVLGSRHPESKVWDPGKKGGRSGARGSHCEVDGEELCMAVILRAGGHEGFAGLEGPVLGV